MPTSHLNRIFTLLILAALCASCGAAPVPARDLPALEPTGSSTVSAPAGTLTIEPTPTVAAASPTRPAPPRGQTRSTGTPAGKQGSDAAQDLPLEVPSHPVDVILGRPTADSITVSILAYQDTEGSIEYGLAPDHYTNQTPLTPLKADQPVEILLNGLQASTTYTYRLRYASSTTDPGTFSTQRAAGSTFTFTIQADSHLDSNSSPQVYEQTLANQRLEQPDFVIDLGDTFMTNKFNPYTDALPQYLAQRYYFSLLGQSAPLFLVLGNHDGEGAPKGTSNAMSTWSAQMRTKYFPNPIPDGFYTGNSTPDPTVGELQDYYAWEWGDALFIVLDPYWFTPSPGGSSSQWNQTLGEAQYQWLKTTLETSRASWKFVFIHQLIGGADRNGRGGVEVAHLYEWGGQNADGTWGFTQQRPGWELPIHQLLVKNHVTAVFHGHDHLFVRQELDGIIYQEVPQPGTARSDNTLSAAEYGYTHGDVLGSSGHLRLVVAPDQVTVEYVRTYLPQDEKPGQLNGQVDASYVIR